MNTEDPKNAQIHLQSVNAVHRSIEENCHEVKVMIVVEQCKGGLQELTSSLGNALSCGSWNSPMD